MRVNDLNVFDLDGTVLRANSFKEVGKALVCTLLKKKKLFTVFNISSWYFARKLNLIEHLKFKRHIVNIFEKELTEEQKNKIVHSVWYDNINNEVLDRMLKAPNCVLSTSAPFSFVKRMPLSDSVSIISALDYTKKYPDDGNYGSGKLENLKYYFKEKTITVSNFYTDSIDDQCLIDFSVNAFMVTNGCITKVK